MNYSFDVKKTIRHMNMRAVDITYNSKQQRDAVNEQNISIDNIL